MKAWWPLGSLLLLAGCSTPEETPNNKVAYRGPDVTIDVQPARAEKFAVTPAANPETPATAPEKQTPKPPAQEATKPRKPRKKEPAKEVKPTPPPLEEEKLPPDETFYPGGKSSRDPDDDPRLDPDWDEKRHDGRDDLP